MLLSLSRELKNAKGKKQYGYLPKRMKKQVDKIVDQMVRLPSVQKCYEKWLEFQHEVNKFYSDKPMECVPLSQQKEFRAIHNAVIQVALRLEHLTFEDKGMARYWFEQAAQELPDAQYALGKLLLADDVGVHDREQGICWLTRAAERGNEFAAYRLAKELLKDGNVTEALPWLTMSAEADNSYGAYLLGKLYWEGEDIPQDMGQAVHWLTQAAERGHPYAQLLLERQDGPSLPSAILAVNSLLHSIGRIFQDNARTMDSTHGQHIDRKLRRRIQEKKIAMGHKPDDHEDQGWSGMSM